MSDELVTITQAEPQSVRWMQRIFAKKQLARIELHHMGPTSASHVAGWTKDSFEAGPQAMIDTIYRAAKDDCDGGRFTGPQRYVAIAVMAEGSREPSERHPFRIAPPNHESDLALNSWSENSEEPQGRAIGLVVQAQRHTEAAVRLALMGSNQNQQRMAHIIDRMAAREDSVAERELRLMELHEQLLSRAHEREIEREDAASRRTLMKTAGEMGLQMLGPLLSKLMPTDEATELRIAQLVTGLSEEQVTAMIALLSPQQQEQFMAVYGIIRDKQAKMAAMQAQAEQAANK